MRGVITTILVALLRLKATALRWAAERKSYDPEEPSLEVSARRIVITRGT
jgi:hypothetical protein